MLKTPWQDRLWPKVDKAGPVALWRGAPGNCWVWTAVRVKGYGVLSTSCGNRYAHRLTYELLVGPIPEGLHIDHRCRRKACCNPAHLEPVTNAENVRRGNAGAYQAQKTHCKQGHPYDAENTLYRRTGGRSCKACHRTWSNEFKIRKKQRER